MSLVCASGETFGTCVFDALEIGGAVVSWAYRFVGPLFSRSAMRRPDPSRLWYFRVFDLGVLRALSSVGETHMLCFHLFTGWHTQQQIKLRC